MVIKVQDAGRRYNREWIFRHLTHTFETGNSYAILGPNGSGKSTLIKTLTGALTPSEGAVLYSDGGGEIDVDRFYQRFTIAAPYTELIEEYTLEELVDFHFCFKRLRAGFHKADFLHYMGLEHARSKEIKKFSSGMKQRVKLALACLSDSEVVFLDEPTSNLDAAGEEWYLKLVHDFIDSDRILIVGSNQEKEYAFCDQQIDIQSYKVF